MNITKLDRANKIVDQMDAIKKEIAEWKESDFKTCNINGSDILLTSSELFNKYTVAVVDDLEARLDTLAVRFKKL